MLVGYLCKYCKDILRKGGNNLQDIYENKDLLNKDIFVLI